MGNEQGKVVDTTTPEGVQAMDEHLQRKFSKGIQHNMKVVIRGDRNTGKTCLLHRMQGRPFTENYVPTDQIQVAHILWTYPGTNDTAKVEIWDVVDYGRSSKKNKKNLKLTNEPLPDELAQSALDAAFLDVYKGSHGAIFMYDVTKQWTWQYIERELQHVPLHIPIVVVGNYADMHAHRVVSKEDAEFYVTHLNRPEGAADIRYAESSMKNGFGLRYLHKFLSVPFLQLQQESLLHQLKANREQLMVIHEELDCNEDQDYEKFVSERNRPVPEKKNIETPPTDTLPQQQSPPPSSTHTDPPPAQPVKTEQNDDSVVKKLSSKFSGFLSKTQTSTSSPKSPGGRRPQQSTGNVDDFVPEGDLDEQFFDDEGEDHDGNEQDTSDSDHDANPQVTLDEDLSSVEEEEIVQPTPVTQKSTPPTPRPLQAARDIVLTESEEEEAGPVVMGDEDIPDIKPEPTKKPASTKGQEQLLISHHTTKPAKKSAELLLDFNESPSPVSKEKARRRSSKESHKKKKSKPVEEKNEDNRQPQPQTNEDPFDFTSSLDAWLAGNDSSPSQPRSTYSISKTIHKSIEEEDDEQEKRPHKSKKKKSRDSEEKKRKKSKSKKSSETSTGGFEDLLL